MKAEELTHKGQTIHYINHEGARGEALIGSIKEVHDYMLAREGLLAIIDFTNSMADKKVMDELKCEKAKLVAKKTKKMAVLGIDGLKKVLLNSYNVMTGANTRAFGTLDEAKDYLVS